MTIYERPDGYWYFLYNWLEYGPFLSSEMAESAAAVVALDASDRHR